MSLYTSGRTILGNHQGTADRSDLSGIGRPPLELPIALKILPLLQRIEKYQHFLQISHNFVKNIKKKILDVDLISQPQ